MSKMMKAKKLGTWFMLALFPMLAFIGSMMFVGNILISLLLGILIVILCIVIANFFLLNHPMIKAIEGDGVLIKVLDSTGIIRHHLAKVVPPYVQSNIFGKRKEISFDRSVLWYSKRFKDGTVEEDKENLYIKLPKKEYSSSVFSMDGLPTLIYNSQLNVFITKDLLSNLETKTFSKHLVIYLTRRVEGLSAHIRDFARHVVEETRPKSSFWEQNKAIVIIGIVLIVIVVVVIAIMFMPAVTQTVGGVMNNSALAANPNPVNPI